MEQIYLAKVDKLILRPCHCLFNIHVVFTLHEKYYGASQTGRFAISVYSYTYLRER